MYIYIQPYIFKNDYTFTCNHLNIQICLRTHMHWNPNQPHINSHPHVHTPLYTYLYIHTPGYIKCTYIIMHTHTIYTLLHKQIKLHKRGYSYKPKDETTYTLGSCRYMQAKWSNLPFQVFNGPIGIFCIHLVDSHDNAFNSLK